MNDKKNVIINREEFSSNIKDLSTKDPSAAVPRVADIVKTSALSVPRPTQVVTKKRLTLDVMSIQKLGELLCQMTSELYIQVMPSKFHPEGKAEALCVDVIDLLRGEEYMLVCNSILARSLQRVEGPITGRYFAIQCGDIVAGKTYRRVDAREVELIP